MTKPSPFTLSRSFAALAFMGTVLLLSACTDIRGDRAVTAGPAIAAPDTVTLRLAEAAEKAANSLNNISMVEQARTPLPPGSEADDLAGAPPELMEPVTITWTGPVERFLTTMANRIGYSFRTTGAPSPVPLTVTINVYNQPLVKVIKSSALQVTGKADVVMDASRQLIELRYAPVDAGPRF